MNLIAHKTARLAGDISIPGSKSHTIRGVVMASLANGTSRLKNPLDSADTLAAFNAAQSFGARIDTSHPGEWIIEGFGSHPQKLPGGPIDMLNSGTSTNLFASVAALGDFEIIIDGDASIRRRPVQPLLDALLQLGAEAQSIGKNGCPPLRIKGPLRGGEAEVDCRSSQYVSSLLITCPLIHPGQTTTIRVRNVCEVPYIQMTLDWLKSLGIQVEQKGYECFRIPGGQSYQPFVREIPADWSSATFPLCAAAMIEGSDCLIKGLDIQDSQADRQVLEHLQKMGAGIEVTDQGIRVCGQGLHGTELDLNNTPDALPAIAATACMAEGVTVIGNVAHARIKETDRIQVMAQELGRMGAKIKETPDGLIIEKSSLHGSTVEGHHDHRVVMALSLAAMAASGHTSITTAEAVNVTFPTYVSLMQGLGACLEMTDGKPRPV
ncbi:MAG: 3-phosphoshikimate 1-carboxyvinyltransferase [bacterium]